MRDGATGTDFGTFNVYDGVPVLDDELALGFDPFGVAQVTVKRGSVFWAFSTVFYACVV